MWRRLPSCRQATSVYFEIAARIRVSSEHIAMFPCHGLEDVPCHLTGADAESLLASWTALWHPVLLAAGGKIPSWRRADEPGSASGEQLVVVPEAARRRVPDGYAADAAAGGMAVIEGGGG